MSNRRLIASSRRKDLISQTTRGRNRRIHPHHVVLTRMLLAGADGSVPPTEPLKGQGTPGNYPGIVLYMAKSVGGGTMPLHKSHVHKQGSPMGTGREGSRSQTLYGLPRGMDHGFARDRVQTQAWGCSRGLRSALAPATR